MTQRQKVVFLIILLLATFVFTLFILPNSVASQNLAMVQIFQPDEAAPLPYLFHMIGPAINLNQALRSFLFYDYYFYGFPYFGLSAALLFPLQWLGVIENIPLVMLILRQLVSVLPMLAALILLTYIQDGFRSYRSVVLFAFLLCVPGVIQNNLWWHPDGITFFFVVLTLFFLKRDNLSFGWNFIFAAATTGIATAIKLVGVYFFLAVGLTLVLGFILKKANWKKLIGMSAAYLLVMGIAFVVADPFLLSHWARTAYGYTFQSQFLMLSEGYGVIYEKGLVAAWPLMRESFGQAIFLLLALGTLVWGAWRGPQRLLHGLILAWFIPITYVVLFVTHFKFQYWLPVILPLFSSLVILLPEKWEWNLTLFKSGFVNVISKCAPFVFLIIVLTQSILFLHQDINIYNSDLHRADNNPRIQFFDRINNALSPIKTGSLYVYYDYRLYIPETTGWITETTYDLLEYKYIQTKNFDVVVLLEQRIRDYLNPDVTGIDPNVFARNQQFYRDAEKGTISGYHLVYRNDVGLVFVRDDLYQIYFHN